MKRDEFKQFVTKTLQESLAYGRHATGVRLPEKIAFSWLGSKEPPMTGDIAEVITSRVFVEEGRIHPCVDIGVSDVLGDSTLIVANISGHPPQPFGKNRHGRDGPFIHCVFGPLAQRVSGGKPPSLQEAGL